MKFTPKILILILIFLNILDIVLTYVGMNGETPMNELNPIYDNLFGIYGILNTLIVIKLTGISIMLYLFSPYIKSGNISYLMKSLKFVNTIYIFIVLNNSYWIIFRAYIGVS